MLAILNTLREHPGADLRGIWDELREQARRKVTHAKVAEVGLAVATAASICYLGYRLHMGLQNFVLLGY